MGVLARRALLFGVSVRAPDFGKLPYKALSMEEMTNASVQESGSRRLLQNQRNLSQEEPRSHDVAEDLGASHPCLQLPTSSFL